MAKKSQFNNEIFGSASDIKKSSLKNDSFKSDAKKTLSVMFEEGLRNAYSFEKQLLEALPQLAHASYSEELQDAFNTHKEHTQKHAERLEKIFNRLHIEHENENCPTIEGHIEKSKQIIDECEEGALRDSALIIVAKKIEHHEIATYESLCELAHVLGYHKIIEILDRILQEEKDTDHHLSSIAVHVNNEAYEITEEIQGN